MIANPLNLIDFKTLEKVAERTVTTAPAVQEGAAGATRTVGRTTHANRGRPLFHARRRPPLLVTAPRPITFLPHPTRSPPP